MKTANNPILTAELYVNPNFLGICSLIDNRAQLESIHSHTFYEIFVVTRGTAIHRINGTSYPIEKGSIIFIRPQDVHGYSQPISPDFQIINLVLTQKLVLSFFNYIDNPLYQNLLLDCKYPVHKKLSSKLLDPLLDNLNQIITYPQDSVCYYNSALKLTAATLISNIFFDNSLISNPYLPVWLNNLVLQLHEPEHYSKGLAHMYELCGYTPAHLCRIFKQYFEQTPTQYLNVIKLNEAARKLIFSDSPIIVIAEETGFNNLSHFYHLFHSRYNMSPKDYRKYSRMSSDSLINKQSAL